MRHKFKLETSSVVGNRKNKIKILFLSWRVRPLTVNLSLDGGWNKLEKERKGEREKERKREREKERKREREKERKREKRDK